MDNSGFPMTPYPARQATSTGPGLWERWASSYHKGLKGLSSSDRAAWEKEYAAEIAGQSDEYKEDLFKSSVFVHYFDPENEEEIKKLRAEDSKVDDDYLAWKENSYNLENLTPEERDFAMARMFTVENVDKDSQLSESPMDFFKDWMVGLFSGDAEESKRLGEKIVAKQSDTVREWALDTLEKTSEDTARTLTQQWMQLPENTQNSLVEEFDSMANELSPYYKAYIGTDKLNLDTNQKLFEYAKFISAAQFAGQDTSIELFQNHIQDTVASNQGLVEKTWNTAKGFGNSAVSMVATAAGMVAGLNYALYGGGREEDEGYWENVLDETLNNPLAIWGDRVASTGSWIPEQQKEYEELGLSVIPILNTVDQQNSVFSANTGFEVVQSQGFSTAMMFLSGGASKAIDLGVKGIATTGRVLGIANRSTKFFKGVLKSGQIAKASLPGVLAATEGQMNAYDAYVSTKKNLEHTVLDKLDQMYIAELSQMVEDNPGGVSQMLAEFGINPDEIPAGTLQKVGTAEGGGFQQVFSEEEKEQLLNLLIQGNYNRQAFDEAHAQDYKDLMEQAEKNAITARNANFWTTTAISGALSSMFQVAQFHPLVQRAIKKKGLSEQLDFANGKAIGKTVTRWDKAKDVFGEIKSEFWEEYLPEVTGSIAEGYTEDKFNQYLDYKFGNGKGEQAFEVDLVSAWSAGLSNALESASNFETIKGGIYGSLGALVGSPNFNENGRLIWRTPITDIIGRAAKRETEANNAIAESVNKSIADTKLPEIFTDARATSKWLLQYNAALQAGDAIGAEDAMVGTIFSSINVLNGLKGTVFHDAIISSLEQRLKFNENKLNDPNSIESQEVDNLLNSPDYKMLTDNMSREEALQTIISNAKQTLDIIKNTEKATRSMQSYLGESANPEFIQFGVLNQLFIDNYKQKLKAIDKQIATAENQLERKFYQTQKDRLVSKYKAAIDTQNSLLHTVINNESAFLGDKANEAVAERHSRLKKNLYRQAIEAHMRGGTAYRTTGRDNYVTAAEETKALPISSLIRLVTQGFNAINREEYAAIKEALDQDFIKKDSDIRISRDRIEQVRKAYISYLGSINYTNDRDILLIDRALTSEEDIDAIFTEGLTPEEARAYYADRSVQNSTNNTEGTSSTDASDTSDNADQADGSDAQDEEVDPRDLDADDGEEIEGPDEDSTSREGSGAGPTQGDKSKKGAGKGGKKDEEKKDKKGNDTSEAPDTDDAQDQEGTGDSEKQDGEGSSDESNGTTEGDNVESDDIIKGKSPSLDEQKKQLDDKGVKHKSKSNQNSYEEATDQDYDPSNTNSMNGNQFPGYDINSLKNNGKLKRAQYSPHTTSGKLMAWLKHNGFHLQEIIDRELSDIKSLYKDGGPKVHFISFNGNEKNGIDNEIKDHIFLALKYDEKVASVHNKDYGEPITINGEQYLLIGIAGYSNKNNFQQNAYNYIKNAVSRKKQQNNRDRAVVLDQTTEIDNIASGRSVHSQEKDTEKKLFSVLDLLNDKERNPDGIAPIDLYWGIHTYKEFMFIGSEYADWVQPSSSQASAGSVYLMQKASDGRYYPAYISPATTETIVQSSELAREITDCCIKLTSRDKNEAAQALNELSNLIVLDDMQNTSGIYRTGDTICFYRSDYKEFINLNSKDFNPQQIFDVVKKFKYRINITAGHLKNEESLKKLSDAGALYVDIAQLPTANASFTVYPVDPNTGLADKSEKKKAPIAEDQEEFEVENKENTEKANNSFIFEGYIFRWASDLQGNWAWYKVDLKNEVYKKITEEDQAFYENIYNILNGKAGATSIQDGFTTYYISSDRQTVYYKTVNGDLDYMQGEKAQSEIQRLTELQAKREREQAILEEAEGLEEGIQYDEGTGEVEVESTNEAIDEELLKEVDQQEETPRQEPPSEVVPNFDPNDLSSMLGNPLQGSKNNVTFAEVFNNDENFKKELLSILRGKGFLKRRADKVEEYLKSKNIDTDNILDKNQFLQNIKDCH